VKKSRLKNALRTIGVLFFAIFSTMSVLRAQDVEKTADPVTAVAIPYRPRVLVSGATQEPLVRPSAEDVTAVTEGGSSTAPAVQLAANSLIGSAVIPAAPVVNAPQEGQAAVIEKISLDLKGIDVNEFFRVLSMKMGVTIVPTKSVSGRVNIYLNDLTYEDALDVVLASQDLASERKDNIINIMTSSEYERIYGKKYNEKRKLASFRLSYAKPSVVFEALGQLKSDIGRIIADESTGTLFLIDIPEKIESMSQTIKELDQPPETQIFALQYAKPADVKTHLTNAITMGVGEVYVDERSNKVIVSDLPQKMKKIRSMVNAFDAPTKQVFIEGEIVQVTLRDEFIRGVNWEKLFQQNNLKGLDFQGSFPLASSFTPSPSLTSNNLKVSIGTIASDNYTAALQFLGTMGNAKILSSPRIAVLNNEEAKILVGSREAFVTQALSQGQSTTVTSESIQFTDVGVKLTVQPTINDEGYVMIKIKPEVSSVREVINTSLGSRIPIVETSEAQTSVKVKDGTMIMIAGLMKDEKREDVTGIPGLSKIPLLGSLFGAKGKQAKKTELIIFITPHIILGDSIVAGTEPQKLVPSDIMPDHIREKFLNENMSKIVPNAKPKLLQPLRKGANNTNQLKSSVLDKKSLEIAPADEFGDKLKDLKEF